MTKTHFNNTRFVQGETIQFLLEQNVFGRDFWHNDVRYMGKIIQEERKV